MGAAREGRSLVGQWPCLATQPVMRSPLPAMATPPGKHTSRKLEQRRPSASSFRASRPRATTADRPRRVRALAGQLRRSFELPPPTGRIRPARRASRPIRGICVPVVCGLGWSRTEPRFCGSSSPKLLQSPCFPGMEPLGALPEMRLARLLKKLVLEPLKKPCQTGPYYVSSRRPAPPPLLQIWIWIKPRWIDRKSGQGVPLRRSRTPVQGSRPRRREKCVLLLRLSRLQP